MGLHPTEPAPVEAANAHVAHVVVDETTISWPLVMRLDDIVRDHLLQNQKKKKRKATDQKTGKFNFRLTIKKPLGPSS